jgi:hypothetical protein
VSARTTQLCRGKTTERWVVTEVDVEQDEAAPFLEDAEATEVTTTAGQARSISE